ncbi:DoxX family protein [Georgenia thermotolerans]|nr:DoxX family protein [Georgenia thermotolerans]
MATSFENRTAGTTPRPAPRYQEELVTTPAARKVLAAGRIIIGWVFLWAFIDKLFGLGFMTTADKAWINGGTPAQGFIKGIEGPFHSVFQVFVNPFGDALFMLGLLGIGVAMMLGAGLRIAAVTGTLLMLFMYLAELPLALGGTNPIVDSHWIEAMLLIISAVTLSGDTWGVGKWWAGVIGKNTWLR